MSKLGRLLVARRGGGARPREEVAGLARAAAVVARFDQW